VRELAIAAPADDLDHLRAALEGTLDGAAEWLALGAAPTLADALTAATDFIAGDRFALHATTGLAVGAGAGMGRALGGSRADVLTIVHRATAGEPPVPAGILAGGPLLLEALQTARLRSATAGLAEALAILEGSGGRVESALADSWWAYDGTADALLAGNRAALDGLERGLPPAGNRVEGRVHVDPRARVVASVLRGPVLIGPHATVSHAYLGPYTALGPDVVVDNAEIEDSVLLAGARVENLSSRLESSVLGPGVVVTRGFELPRALRLAVGDGARIELA
jgi:hypothetical protein